MKVNGGAVIVETTAGKVQGVVGDGIEIYKGIRYGAPPTGAKRFLPPEKPKPWNGVADATQYGAPAIQLVNKWFAIEEATEQTQPIKIFTLCKDEIEKANEDCLFLNLWTPNSKQGKRPVMVWLHGGAFCFGSGGLPVYDGSNLAAHNNVVVITVNHRLNVFGYLDLSGLHGEKYAKSGNAGMLDLVLALEWVRDNIEAFGGDPDNVTIMGQSGGASKVATLLTMPAAKGLVHKAVLQSVVGAIAMPQDRAREFASAVLKELNIMSETINQIETVPADKLVAAAHAAAAKVGGERARDVLYMLRQVVDGDVLPSQPFIFEAPSQASDVPLIISWNKDEWSPFLTVEPKFGALTEDQVKQHAATILGEKVDFVYNELKRNFPDYSPPYLLCQLMSVNWILAGAITIAEHKSRQPAPVYMCELAWETPIAGGAFKCPHGLEIPFIFDNVENTRLLLGPGEDPQKLADQMSKAWVAFARTGNPNINGLPEWPPYDEQERATMIFDVKSQVVNDPLGGLRRMFSGSKPDFSLF